jgi:hypothetical protein
MVVVVIAFPGLVMHYKSGHKVADPANVHINVPMPGAGGGDPFANPFATPGGDAPAFGAPPAPGATPETPAAPSFGTPAPSFGAPAKQP